MSPSAPVPFCPLFLLLGRTYGHPELLIVSSPIHWDPRGCPYLSHILKGCKYTGAFRRRFFFFFWHCKPLAAVLKKKKRIKLAMCPSMTDRPQEAADASNLPWRLRFSRWTVHLTVCPVSVRAGTNAASVAGAGPLQR